MVIMCRLYLFILVYLPVFLLLGTATGEPQHIRLQCGDVKNVTSPDYPKQYPNAKTARWTVEVDAGRRIVVTFNNFQTEELDGLLILDVNYPSTELKYRGQNAFTPYISLGNRIMMTFSSDSSQSRMGFHLSISCWKDIKYDTVHKAFEGHEHTRILTQSICKDDWNTNVADTICREAGFPGSYNTNFTSGIENFAGSDGTVYQCNKSTFRLQDCEMSTCKCNITPQSPMIMCNGFSTLGCFDLTQYIHLLIESVQLSRDQCVAHCHTNRTTPQYAVHQNGTRCSCINQMDINIKTLYQERDRCVTDADSQSLTWATLFNASFGFCEELPQLNNGSWKSTSDGYMYGSTITAVCDDEFWLVGGHQVLKCGKGSTTSSQHFEWHGTIPSCQERNNSNGPSDVTPLTGSETSGPTSPFITTQINERDIGIILGIWLPVGTIVIIIMVPFIGWFIYRLYIKVKDGDQLCLLSPDDSTRANKRGHCREICFVRRLWGFFGCTESPTKERDREEEVPTLQKICRDSDSCVKEQPPKTKSCQV